LKSSLVMLATLLLTPVATLRAADGPPRMNVLFLFADDQRADTIAALGNPLIKTPNLDRLVKRGVASLIPIGLIGNTSRAVLSRTTVEFFSPSIKWRPTAKAAGVTRARPEDSLTSHVKYS
jgi:hypothetical protein